MSKKFFTIPVGETFFIDSRPCRKASTISYVVISESLLGEVYYDPIIEPKLQTQEEFAAANAPAKPVAKKAVKKTAVKKVAVKAVKKAPAKAAKKPVKPIPKKVAYKGPQPGGGPYKTKKAPVAVAPKKVAFKKPSPKKVVKKTANKKSR